MTTDTTMADTSETDSNARYDAGGEDAGGEDAGANPVPILERTPNLTYDCSQTRAMSETALPQWYGKAMAKHNGAIGLLRGGGADVAFSTVATDGTLGAEVVFGDSQGVQAQHPSLATMGTGSVAVWAESSTSSISGAIFYAHLDETGNPTGGVVEIAGSRDSSASNPQVVVDGSRIFVLWASSTNGRFSLKFVEIDSSGTAQGQAVALTDSAFQIENTGLVKTANGFAATFSEPTSGLWTVYYLAFDAQGTLAFQPKRVSLPNISANSPTITTTSDGILIAYVEVNMSSSVDEGYTIVRLVQYDLLGNQQGANHPLQAKVMDRENIDPFLVDLGQDIAVVWSAGTIIYICAGCVPDNSIEFVILDRDSLVPKSAHVRHPNPSEYSGLVNPVCMEHNLDFLTFVDVAYHVYSVPGSGLIHCDSI